MRRFIKHLNPSVIAIMETEIWPNLLVAAQKENVPVVFINARLSEKSVRNYKLIKPLISKIFGNSSILAISDTFAERFIAIGAREVKVIGNIKFDAVKSADSSKREKFRENIKAIGRPGHLQQYSSLKKQLESFQTKKEFRVDFDTIGKDFYIQFTDHLKEIGLKPNSIGSYIKKLKRLMNEAVEDKLTKNQEHCKRDFKIISENVDTVYLNENEIKALYEMPLDLPVHRNIRDIFVINCYTGLRHSDWSKVSNEHIHEGNLYVRTQKTDEPVIMPIKPLVWEILKRYGTLQVPHIRQTNGALKLIGQKAHDEKISKGDLKKWLVIRTHTARRSFATNAYLAGIPMRDIMQITGHHTTESFLRYIRVTKMETAQKLKDHPFFS